MLTGREPEARACREQSLPKLARLARRPGLVRPPRGSSSTTVNTSSSSPFSSTGCCSVTVVVRRPRSTGQPRVAGQGQPACPLWPTGGTRTLSPAPPPRGSWGGGGAGSGSGRLSVAPVSLFGADGSHLVAVPFSLSAPWWALGLGTARGMHAARGEPPAAGREGLWSTEPAAVSTPPCMPCSRSCSSAKVPQRKWSASRGSCERPRRLRAGTMGRKSGGPSLSVSSRSDSTVPSGPT